MIDEAEVRKSMWRRIDKTREEIDAVRRNQAVLEHRVGMAETINAEIRAELKGLREDVGGLRKDISNGHISLRVILWVGGVATGVIGYLTWIWLELQKLGN